jgi:hypothetical protein
VRGENRAGEARWRALWGRRHPALARCLEKCPDSVFNSAPQTTIGLLLAPYFQDLPQMWGTECYSCGHRNTLMPARYGLRQRIFVHTDHHCVPLRTSWLTNQPTGMALRDPVLLTSPRNRLPTPFGAYKFPEAISLRTCLSSERSATRRFNRAFSFSRSFSRLA